MSIRKTYIAYKLIVYTSYWHFITFTLNLKNMNMTKEEMQLKMQLIEADILSTKGAIFKYKQARKIERVTLFVFYTNEDNKDGFLTISDELQNDFPFNLNNEVQILIADAIFTYEQKILELEKALQTLKDEY